jgi:hypothetical protein
LSRGSHNLLLWPLHMKMKWNSISFRRLKTDCGVPSLPPRLPKWDPKMRPKRTTPGGEETCVVTAVLLRLSLSTSLGQSINSFAPLVSPSNYLHHHIVLLSDTRMKKHTHHTRPGWMSSVIPLPW